MHLLKHRLKNRQILPDNLFYYWLIMYLCLNYDKYTEQEVLSRNIRDLLATREASRLRKANEFENGLHQ